MNTNELDTPEEIKNRISKKTGVKKIEFKFNDEEKRKKNYQALQRILTEMERQGLHIDDVCRKVGISRQIFHAWIDRNSYINIHDFCQISKLLNVPMDTLYRGRELGNLKGLTVDQKKLIHIAYEHNGREVKLLFNTLSMLVRSGPEVFGGQDQLESVENISSIEEQE